MNRNRGERNTPVQIASEITSMIDSEYDSGFYGFFRDIFIYNLDSGIQNSEPIKNWLDIKRESNPAFCFFSNQEIIIHLLSNLPKEWHADHIEIYQNLLKKYSPKNNLSTRSLMQFLANIDLGISNSCLEAIDKEPLKPETLLGLQMLNVIRAVQEQDTKRANYWEQRCRDQIARFEENMSNQKHYENAIYCLPILGALYFKTNPGSFVYLCIKLSFDATNGLPMSDHYLMSHIEVYFRNAILQLCKREDFISLLEIERDCTGWTESLFERVFNSAYMEECRDDMEKAKRSQQEKGMSRPPEHIVKEIDTLVENPQN